MQIKRIRLANYRELENNVATYDDFKELVEKYDEKREED